MMKWARLETPKDTYHIIPVNDERDHEESECWCDAVSTVQPNGDWLIVHNSADGREQFEGLPIL